MHTETTGVVKVIKKKWKDNSLHKVGCEILYGIIKRDYMDYPTVHTAHNENMWHGYLHTAELLDPSDKFHLSPKATSLLASNMKKAMHTVLKIGNIVTSKGHTNKHRNRPGNHFQTNNGNRYCRSSPSWNHQYQGCNHNRQSRHSPNYLR